MGSESKTRCKTAIRRSKNIFISVVYIKNGRSERIRTSDPLVPNEVRYQAALHSDRRLNATLRPYRLRARRGASARRRRRDDHNLAIFSSDQLSSRPSKLLFTASRFSARKAELCPQGRSDDKSWRQAFGSGHIDYQRLADFAIVRRRKRRNRVAGPAFPFADLSNLRRLCGEIGLRQVSINSSDLW